MTRFITLLLVVRSVGCDIVVDVPDGATAQTGGLDLRGVRVCAEPATPESEEMAGATLTHGVPPSVLRPDCRDCAPLGGTQVRCARFTSSGNDWICFREAEAMVCYCGTLDGGTD